ncbi:MAG TPA: ferritin-like domain-containing protein [Candidatus Eisenbacteria bacterium]|nr:ferritin-like domain-containing protein [Candidatus Eisenbacteria bacterium]
MDSLEKLFVDQLKDIYNAEKQLVKALPQMAKAATDEELQGAFNTHLQQTEKQVERLEQIFKEIGKSPQGKRCAAMEGLIEEAKELLKEDAEEEVLDAGLIGAAQKVEHYEMAAYGTLRTYAGLLSHEKAEKLLEETLREEKEADRILTDIAERSINVEAVHADADED